MRDGFFCDLLRAIGQDSGKKSGALGDVSCLPEKPNYFFYMNC